MHDLEDHLRTQRLGATLGDASKAGTSLYGPLAGAPDIIKDAFTLQQRDMRRMAEATQASINSAIAAGGYIPSGEFTRHSGVFGVFLKLLGVCLVGLSLLFAAIVAVGIGTAPDHSHVDVQALRDVKLDRASYAPTDPRVQKLAGLPITTIRRQHLGSSYIRPGEAATDQQLIAGHAIWLRYLDNPDGYRKLDVSLQETAHNLVSAYLTDLAVDTGSVQPLIDLGNERAGLNPWRSGTPSERIWQELALASPDDPVLEALATDAFGFQIEYRFERGLSYLLSLVGL